MTKQELFDKVAKHLITQGERAANSNGSCMYRGNGNTRCAIGCLIPDADYRPQFEGVSVGVGVDVGIRRHTRSEILRVTGITAETLPLATVLQDTHDDVRSWGDIREALREVAEEFELDTDVLGVKPIGGGR